METNHTITPEQLDANVSSSEVISDATLKASYDQFKNLNDELKDMIDLLKDVNEYANNGKGKKKNTTLSKRAQNLKERYKDVSTFELGLMCYGACSGASYQMVIPPNSVTGGDFYNKGQHCSDMKCELIRRLTNQICY